MCIGMELIDLHDMSMNNVSVYRSPCEILRKINDKFQGDSKEDVEVRQLLAECEEMSKQMSIEVHKFNPDYFKSWPTNRTVNQDDNFRKQPTYKYK